jgi:hypothetical protein
MNDANTVRNLSIQLPLCASSRRNPQCACVHKFHIRGYVIQSTEHRKPQSPLGIYMKVVYDIIVLQVKSRRMRWAGHVARMGGEESVKGFGGKARRKDPTRKTKA